MQMKYWLDLYIRLCYSPPHMLLQCSLSLFGGRSASGYSLSTSSCRRIIHPSDHDHFRPLPDQHRPPQHRDLHHLNCWGLRCGSIDLLATYLWAIYILVTFRVIFRCAIISSLDDRNWLIRRMEIDSSRLSLISSHHWDWDQDWID